LLREHTYTAFRTVVEPFVLQFEDTQSSFQKKSSFDLMQSLVVLRLCAMEPLVKYAPKLIQASIYAKLDALVFFVIKRTFFKHFCAGEDLDEVREVIGKLHDASIGSILDYSAEGAVGNDADLDTSALRIMETIELGQTFDSIKFACLKAYNPPCPALSAPPTAWTTVDSVCFVGWGTHRSRRSRILGCWSGSARNASDSEAFTRLIRRALFRAVFFAPSPTRCDDVGLTSGWGMVQAIEALSSEDRASLDLVLARLSGLSSQVSPAPLFYICFCIALYLFC
jgi:hypothetical protein